MSTFASDLLLFIVFCQNLLTDQLVIYLMASTCRMRGHRPLRRRTPPPRPSPSPPPWPRASVSGTLSPPSKKSSRLSQCECYAIVYLQPRLVLSKLLLFFISARTSTCTPPTGISFSRFACFIFIINLNRFLVSSGSFLCFNSVSSFWFLPSGSLLLVHFSPFILSLVLSGSFWLLLAPWFLVPSGSV